MRTAIAAGVALLAGVGAAQANLIVNGGFELPAISPANSVTYGVGENLGGWTVVGSIPRSTAVTLLTNAYAENGGALRFLSQEGQQNLDLTGPGWNGTDKGVEQAVATTTGTPYLLTFYFGNQDDSKSNYPLNSSALLRINGTTIGAYTTTGTTPDNVTWQQFSYSFTAASSSTTITFLNNVGDSDNYVGLDNVVLVVVPTAAPEPLSAGLLGAGLLGLGLARRARRR